MIYPTIDLCWREKEGVMLQLLRRFHSSSRRHPHLDSHNPYGTKLWERYPHKPRDRTNERALSSWDYQKTRMASWDSSVDRTTMLVLPSLSPLSPCLCLKKKISLLIWSHERDRKGGGGGGGGVVGGGGGVGGVNAEERWMSIIDN